MIQLLVLIIIGGWQGALVVLDWAKDRRNSAAYDCAAWDKGA